MGKYNILTEGKEITIESDEEETSHRIHVNHEIYEELKKMEADLSKKLGAKITPSVVIKSLITEHENLAEIKKGLQESEVFLKKMLEMSLSQKQVIVGAGIPSGVPSGMPSGLMPPPPPQVPPKPKKILPIDDPDLKKNFVNELKNVFTPNEQGNLKASEIIKKTETQFKDIKEKTPEEISQEKSKIMQKMFDPEHEAKIKQKPRQETSEEREERLKAVQSAKVEADEYVMPKLTEESEVAIASQIAFINSLLNYLNATSFESSAKVLEKEEEKSQK